MKFTLFLSFCLLTVLRVNADEDPWVDLLVDTVELTGSADSQIISIPISFATGVNIKKVKIEYNQPMYIQLDKKFDQNYFNALSLLPLSTDSAPAIRIAVNLTKLRQAGTYKIYLLISDGDKKTKQLTISVIRPQAKIDPPQTIHIDMVGNDIIRQDPFVVRETANVNIHGLGIQSPLFSGVNSDKLVTFDSAEYNVQGRHRLFASYSLNKKAISDLPIGKTTTGTLDIYAPELGTTVNANFEITNKASPWWIFWLLFAGVACGTFMRQYLKSKKEISEKKLDAMDLLNKIHVETSDIKDKAFLNEVGALTETLGNKLKETAYINRWAAFAKELGDLTVLTASKYADLRKDFDDRAKVARDKLAGLSFLFGDNRLSIPIKNRLQPAQGFYQHGIGAIKDLNVTVAEDDLKRSISAVNDFLADYSQAITRLFGDDGSHLVPAALSQPVKDEFKLQCIFLLQQVQKLNTGASDIDSLIGSVRTADTIQLKLQGLLDSLLDATEEVFKTIWKDDKSELMVKFKSSMEAWETYARDLLQNPKVLIDPSYLINLNDNWNSVLKAKEKQEHILGGEDRPNNRPRLGGTMFHLLGSQMVLGKFEFMDISSQEVVWQRTLQEVRLSWFTTSLLQSLIIFALMVLTAYLFYAPNFNGTVQEKISLFVFAFGLNISMDSLNLIRDRKPGAIN
jgi:hypothetical protein